MKRFIAAGLLLLITAACSGLPQVTPTITVIPTQTPSNTPTPSPVPPSETPPVPLSSLWNGIPIMPGAIAGEGDDEGYVFTIQATTQQVQDYYQQELGELGWRPFSQEISDSALTMIFTDESAALLTLNILFRGEQSLVLLTK